MYKYMISAYMYTGWRRPIGSRISLITFRKLATNYRALLRKITYKDKASYDSTPPCTYTHPKTLRDATQIYSENFFRKIHHKYTARNALDVHVVGVCMCVCIHTLCI